MSNYYNRSGFTPALHALLVADPAIRRAHHARDTERDQGRCRGSHKTGEREQMTRVLACFGSKRGGTAGLAAMIGDALIEAGCDAVVTPAKDVVEVGGFDAVIVAGALYAYGWHRDARRFCAPERLGVTRDTSLAGQQRPTGHLRRGARHPAYGPGREVGQPRWRSRQCHLRRSAGTGGQRLSSRTRWPRKRPATGVTPRTCGVGCQRWRRAAPAAGHPPDIGQMSAAPCSRTPTGECSSDDHAV